MHKDYDNNFFDDNYLSTTHYDNHGNPEKEKESKVIDCSNNDFIHGKSKICSYIDGKYVLSSNEKSMITNSLKDLDIFNNPSIKTDKYSKIKLEYNENDYDAYGMITLFVNSDFDELKDLMIERIGNYEDLKEYQNISFKNDDGNIYFYKNNDNKYCLVFSYPLPYEYKSDKISNQSLFIKYFLSINENNIKENKKTNKKDK